MAIAVIGSGLSGLACVKALVRRGIKPIVIDAGVTLEPKVQTIVDRLRAAGPQAWSKTDLEMIRRNDFVTKAGVPRKFVFGSDFIYARDVPEAALSGDNVRASITLAKGGFGNAWGAAILPADRADLAGDWPAPALELEPHYRAVMRWLPCQVAQMRSLVILVCLHIRQARLRSRRREKSCIVTSRTRLATTYASAWRDWRCTLKARMLAAVVGYVCRAAYSGRSSAQWKTSISSGRTTRWIPPRMDRTEDHRV